MHVQSALQVGVLWPSGAGRGSSNCQNLSGSGARHRADAFHAAPFVSDYEQGGSPGAAKHAGETATIHLDLLQNLVDVTVKHLHRTEPLQ